MSCETPNAQTSIYLLVFLYLFTPYDRVLTGIDVVLQCASSLVKGC